MVTIPVDLSLEIRSADGTSAAYYQTDEGHIREALHFLAAPRLFAQPHLLLTSESCAAMLPCKGIDIVRVHTSASLPIRFPLKLPIGLFDIVEDSEELRGGRFSEIENHQAGRPAEAVHRASHVKIRTLGGWSVSLKVEAAISGKAQDERQLFYHLPDVPTIKFRLEAGGFGLTNTNNISCASASPKPEAISGVALPLTLRSWTASPEREHKTARALDHP